MASNTGALVTLPSSLAGLLWSRILGQKGKLRSPHSIRNADALHRRSKSHASAILTDQFDTRLHHHIFIIGHRAPGSHVLVVSQGIHTSSTTVVVLVSVLSLTSLCFVISAEKICDTPHERRNERFVRSCVCAKQCFVLMKPAHKLHAHES